MSAASTLDYPTLKELTGYQRQGDVESCLKKQGIRFFLGRAGVWTTLDLVNAAGGLKVPEKTNAYSPDLI